LFMLFIFHESFQLNIITSLIIITETPLKIRWPKRMRGLTLTSTHRTTKKGQTKLKYYFRKIPKFTKRAINRRISQTP
jgi:hypothetical protein